ncbi:unnamed protein product, partial [Ectocarpus sp. 8 AP-2014]
LLVCVLYCTPSFFFFSGRDGSFFLCWCWGGGSVVTQIFLSFLSVRYFGRLQSRGMAGQGGERACLAFSCPPNTAAARIFLYMCVFRRTDSRVGAAKYGGCAGSTLFVRVFALVGAADGHLVCCNFVVVSELAFVPPGFGLEVFLFS